MESSETLKETVKRAKKEVEDLLTDVQAGRLDRSKLDAGLTELKCNLKVLGIHIGRDDKDPDKHDPK